MNRDQRTLQEMVNKNLKMGGKRKIKDQGARERVQEAEYEALPSEVTGKRRIHLGLMQ